MNAGWLGSLEVALIGVFGVGSILVAIAALAVAKSTYRFEKRHQEQERNEIMPWLKFPSGELVRDPTGQAFNLRLGFINPGGVDVDLTMLTCSLHCRGDLYEERTRPEKPVRAHSTEYYDVSIATPTEEAIWPDKVKLTLEYLSGGTPILDEWERELDLQVVGNTMFIFNERLFKYPYRPESIPDFH